MAPHLNSIRKDATEQQKSLRLALVANGGNFETLLRRAKRSPALGGFDDLTVRKSVACCQAKQLAAAFVRAARKHAGWTMQKLADRVGCHKTYVAHAESLNNDMKIPLDFLLLVAAATGYPFQLGVPVRTGADKERLDTMLDGLTVSK